MQQLTNNGERTKFADRIFNSIKIYVCAQSIVHGLFII